MKGAEGARKISVFFASRRLSVPVVATEAIAIPWITKIYCNARARLSSTLPVVTRSSPPSLRGRKSGKRSERAHFAHPHRDAPYRRIEEILANKCIINALKRTSTMHNCVYSHAIYLRNARTVARKLPSRNFKNTRVILLFKRYE